MGGQSKRVVLGVVTALAGDVLVGLVMVPLRAHVGVATAALVLVVPVVLAVAAGGFVAGVLAVVAGFLVYDLFFIPPYGTLSVGAGQNWVALGVYVAVLLVVARVVARLAAARAEARAREQDTRALLELSEALIGETPLAGLLDVVVAAVREVFGLRSVALLLPAARAADGMACPGGSGSQGGDGPLVVAAWAGAPLAPEELQEVVPSGGEVRSRAVPAPGTDATAAVTLGVASRPVGVLAFAGVVPSPHGLELLRTYANHAALAIERAQLRERAERSDRLEQADVWRRALLGAVSHDLRTPLATVKAAISDLRDAELSLCREDEQELLGLVETQADRLERLVANLLGMAQIEGGALRLQLAETTVEELLAEALGVLGPAWPGRVATSLPLTLPAVEVDHVLAVQVLVNLVENAARHAPDGTRVELAARTVCEQVEVAVEDRGPGVPVGDRERIFAMFATDGGGRAGLGLTIARSFVEAHGGTIRVDDRPGGGARFVFTLPRARRHAEVP